MDFARGRFGNPWLAPAIGLPPHSGDDAVYRVAARRHAGLIRALGFTRTLAGNLPLIIAFVIFAAFTDTSGLRAPAMIAVVKDLLIYITVIAAVIVIPIKIKLRGFGRIFAMVHLLSSRGQTAAGVTAGGGRRSDAC